MSQYNTGTVTVTNGSAVVTGSGTLWAAETAAGDLFLPVGDDTSYEVGSVDSDTQITLAANYAGTTGAGKSYALTRDFTPVNALPYPAGGDIETATIFKRAMSILDTLYSAVGLASQLFGAAAKTTPVDADTIGITDSAASNALKKVTWANIKSTLKAHFDSLTTTLTNKRVTARVTTEASSATPTINTDNSDVHRITALALAITSMTTNLSGTPVNGDGLIIEITDNGTARAITWGASFEASTVALPTTTVISTKLTVGFLWNATTSKWTCVGVA